MGNLAKRLPAWFAAKERRWLYLREKDRKDLLGDAEAFVVAKGGAGVVVTNHPLPGAAR